MKKVFGLVFMILLMSCTAKKTIAVKKMPINKMSAETVIANHYNVKNDFKTLYLRSGVRYSGEYQTQNVTAEIKILKDEKILVSIRFLGITMAKALITPQEVSYYEKINSNYFEGDFSTLSKWLGTDLDFFKIQNILLGEAMEDLKKGEYNVTFEDTTFRLNSTSSSDIQKTYFIEDLSFLVKKQEISQLSKNRKLQVVYPDFKTYTDFRLPTSLEIQATENTKKTSISIANTNVTINEELTFPYKVPQGYTRILID
ncbi:MAG: DUF4292 domain-containing protein [Flavobacterium sp.]